MKLVEFILRDSDTWRQSETKRLINPFYVIEVHEMVKTEPYRKWSRIYYMNGGQYVQSIDVCEDLETVKKELEQ